MLEIPLQGEDRTLALGEAIGREAPAGLRVLLTGCLGAGKTRLAKGIARGLKTPDWERVTSPTFKLVNIWRGGRLPLVHVDLYRLGPGGAMPQDIFEAIETKNAISAIEWPEAFERELASLDAPCVLVRLEVTSEDSRQAALEGPPALLAAIRQHMDS